MELVSEGVCLPLEQNQEAPAVQTGSLQKGGVSDMPPVTTLAPGEKGTELLSLKHLVSRFSKPFLEAVVLPSQPVLTTEKYF